MSLKMVGSIFVIAFLLLGGSRAFAQTAGTGALTGTVKDPSGAVIAGATVTVTNSGTGQARTAMTGADGVYKVNLLPPGSYNVKFSAAGFNPVEVPSVEIVVTETPVLDRTLAVGSTNQEVTVQANVETVQTASSTVGTVVASKTVTDLPLTTRNFTNLISLTAGASADVNNSTLLGKGWSYTSVNGANASDNNFQQDGAAVDNWGSSSAGSENGFYGGIPIPNPDAIQEFKIQTSAYDAGYGRNAGANVNVVTKSGTNQFHGTLFEFFRNTALDANEFFYKRSELLRGAPNRQATFDQNQYGGVVGGPIKKDKLFFFLSYQETQQRNGLVSYGFETAFLPPIPGGNRGNCTAANGGNPNWASCAGDPVGAAFIAALGAANAGATGVRGPGTGLANTVAANGSNINPIAINILQLKLPGGGYYIQSPSTLPAAGHTVQTTYSDPATYKDHQPILNVDFVINSKNTLSTRTFMQDDPTQAPLSCLSPGSPGNCVPGSPITFKYPNDTNLLKLTTVLSSNVVNEARVSYQRNQTISHNDTPFTNAQVGITGLQPVSAPQLFNITVTNEFNIGGHPWFGLHLTDNQFQAADQISWSRGRHSLRAGGEIGHFQFIYVGPSIAIGQGTFSTFADFLIGRCGGSVASGCANSNGTAFSNEASLGVAGGVNDRANNGNLEGTFLANNVSAFIQDDFKVNSRLTLNLGLRWEWDGFPQVKNGQTSNFWPGLVALQPIPGSTPATGSLAGYVVPSNWTNGPLPAGVFKSNLPVFSQNAAPLNDFAPRLGFAWKPLGGSIGDRLVLRGGAGIFYSQPNGQRQTLQGFPGAPYGVTPFLSPLDTLANPLVLPATIPGPPGSIGWQPRYVNFTTFATSNLSATQTNAQYFAIPATYEWNLETQYEFLPSWVLEVGYVGSRGIHQTGGSGNSQGGNNGQNAPPVNVANLASAASPLYCGYDGNPAHCITTNSPSNVVDRTPLLGFASGSATFNSSVGDSRFNSAQVTVRKNFSRGLQFQASYTFARSFVNYWIGNPAAIAPGISPVISAYGQNGGYHPQRLVINYSWDLPFGKHEGFLGVVTGGWTWSGVTTIQTGTPLTFTTSAGGSAFTNSGGPLLLASYCPGMGKGNIASSGSTEARVVNGLSGGTGWVNPAVFAGQATSPAGCTFPTIPAALGTGTEFGGAGIGQVTGPGQNNWDMALAKTTRVGGLSEGATLVFRAEVFNTWNHPQFNDPAINSSLGSLGQVSASSVGPRLMQFGFKYVF